MQNLVLLPQSEHFGQKYAVLFVEHLFKILKNGTGLYSRDTDHFIVGIQGDPEYMILFQHVITLTHITLFQNRKLEISKFYLISESLILK